MTWNHPSTTQKQERRREEEGREREKEEEERRRGEESTIQRIYSFNSTSPPYPSPLPLPSILITADGIKEALRTYFTRGNKAIRHSIMCVINPTSKGSLVCGR